VRPREVVHEVDDTPAEGHRTRSGLRQAIRRHTGIGSGGRRGGRGPFGGTRVLRQRIDAMSRDDRFPRILNLTVSNGASLLDEAEHLAAYDGILFDPLWFCFHGGREWYQAAPGETVYAITVGEVPTRLQLMEQRAEQLRSFLQRGGVLVVRALAPASLALPPSMVVDTWSWITSAIAHDRLVTHPHPGAPARYVHGTDLVVVDVEHPVVMDVVGGYDAELAAWLLEIDGARVTAINRAGDPVGLDIPYGRGTVMIVPMRRGLGPELHLGLLEALLHNQPPVEEPMLSDEAVLDEENQAIDAQASTRRQELDERRGALGERKRRMLAQDHVQRALEHWRKATAVGASERTILQELYALLEIVEQAVGGRERIAAALGISSAVAGDIGRFSNERVHGIRHTTDEPLQPLPAGTIPRCREHGTTLLRAYLDWELAKIR
jgi:hypothetical protein